MSRKLLSLTVTAALSGGIALADVPSVAVDIAPVHSLVARVMVGVGEPDLIVPSGESPHGFSLRPSAANALQNADVVFWVGEDLTPQLENSIETLAKSARVTALLDADGVTLLEFREGALFEAHDHDEHGDEEHAGHDDHGDHEHDEAKAEDHDHLDEDHATQGGHDDHEHKDAEAERHDHEHEHDDHEDHAEHDHHEHGDHDPHAWLSPKNAAVWLNVIAAQLSAADPENAGAYFANAAEARAELDALSVEVNTILDPARGGSFIVFHDAYQYFEADFNFPASGAISLSDASDPSPARIAEIHGRVRDEGVGCVLAEPQFNPGIIAIVLEGTEAKTGVIDPLGASLELGPDLYPQLIRNMASTLAECLATGV